MKPSDQDHTVFLSTYKYMLITGMLQFNRIKIGEECTYGKCSNFSDTSCLLKRSRQTVQTQIRLLRKKQSDRGSSLFAILTSIL